MTLIASGAYKSTTAEQMLLEAAFFIQALEGNDLYNTSSPKANKVNVVINSDAKTATITATLPVTFDDTATGGSTVSASEYLATPGGTALTAQP